MNIWFFLSDADFTARDADFGRGLVVKFVFGTMLNSCHDFMPPNSRPRQDMMAEGTCLADSLVLPQTLSLAKTVTREGIVRI